MPKLISIAVESPGRYVAVDSESNLWRGQVVTRVGSPPAIKWARVTSEFPGSNEPVQLTGGPAQPGQDD
jgi:hypothetical protein